MIMYSRDFQSWDLSHYVGKEIQNQWTLHTCSPKTLTVCFIYRFVHLHDRLVLSRYWNLWLNAIIPWKISVFDTTLLLQEVEQEQLVLEYWYGKKWELKRCQISSINIYWCFDTTDNTTTDKWIIIMWRWRCNWRLFVVDWCVDYLDS